MLFSLRMVSVIRVMAVVFPTIKMNARNCVVAVVGNLSVKSPQACPFSSTRGLALQVSRTLPVSSRPLLPTIQPFPLELCIAVFNKLIRGEVCQKGYLGLSFRVPRWFVECPIEFHHLPHSCSLAFLGGFSRSLEKAPPRTPIRAKDSGTVPARS